MTGFEMVHKQKAPGVYKAAEKLQNMLHELAPGETQITVPAPVLFMLTTYIAEEFVMAHFEEIAQQKEPETS